MADRQGSGHARGVRLTHWMAAVSVAALAFSGVEILMVHPRLYWGEAGNDLTPPLLELPISRNYQHGGWTVPTPLLDGPGAPVSAGRTFEIFNENGWGRSLHFLAAWVLVATGLVYVLAGVVAGHTIVTSSAGARRSRPRRSVAICGSTCAAWCRRLRAAPTTDRCSEPATRSSSSSWHRFLS